MRYSFFILVLTLACLCACNKADIVRSTGGLEGKWYYTAQYYSIGGPGEWHAQTPPYHYLLLSEGGRVQSDFEPFNQSTGWKSKDSTTLLFTFAGSSRDSILFRYQLDTVNNELRFSPIQPMCIEGCGIKFTR